MPYPVDDLDGEKLQREFSRIKDTRPDCSDVSYMNKPWLDGYKETVTRVPSKDEDETDPNGLNAKEKGAKLDSNKINVTRGCLHYFPRAIRAVAELSTIGAKKYSWKGWQDVPDGIHRYGDALGRHELQIEDDFGRRDSDTGVLEATAVAWNALARLELILRGNNPRPGEPT